MSQTLNLPKIPLGLPDSDHWFLSNFLSSQLHAVSDCQGGRHRRILDQHHWASPLFRTLVSSVLATLIALWWVWFLCYWWWPRWWWSFVFTHGYFFLVVFGGNICQQQVSFPLPERKIWNTVVLVPKCHMLPKLQHIEPPGDDASWERIHQSHLLCLGACQTITIPDLTWQVLGLLAWELSREEAHLT